MEFLKGGTLLAVVIFNVVLCLYLIFVGLTENVNLAQPDPEEIILRETLDKEKAT